MANQHSVMTKNGIEVPFTVFEPEKGAPKAVLLFMAALGVKARFYTRLAEALVAGGIAVILLEQRGHGDSRYRPSHKVNFGYREYLEEDIPTVRAWLADRYVDQPFYIGGHSLGAHMASMTTGLSPEGITGLLHVGCVFPYYGLYDRKAAFGLRFLCAVIPVISAVMGYYPGTWFGFGSKEFRRAIMDWRQWTLKGDYNFGPYQGIEEKMAAYEGRFLSLALDHDTFASPGATAKPRATMASADLTTKLITATEQGQHIGHFDWARKPDGVVQVILTWLENKGEKII